MVRPLAFDLRLLEEFQSSEHHGLLSTVIVLLDHQSTSLRFDDSFFLCIKRYQLVSTSISVDIFLARAREHQALDILHEHLFLVLAGSIKLSMGLIYV